MQRRLSVYDEYAIQGLKHWQKSMQRKPNIFNQLSRNAQLKINSWIPEKVHEAVTVAIKQMVRGVLFGAKYTTGEPLKELDLKSRELIIEDRIKFYRTTAAVEGGITGAGGILLGLADFPILLTLKLKLLFDIGARYGHDLSDYRERLYILHIFELAFSSQHNRRIVYQKLVDWENKVRDMPNDIHQFEWRKFQQEYRDYIDLAKMAQLIPVIGAPVGVIANYGLIKKLGNTAMNAYRMRWFKQ